MNENPELNQLYDQAIETEKRTFFPDGKYVDGAPYQGDEESLELIKKVRQAVGGKKAFEQYIKDQLHGNPNCGNWWVVAALKLTGVPLREEPLPIE